MISIETRNLGLNIGGAKILNDVSLSAQQGQILGVIGPNGAGKTSLFNLISGVRKATSGQIFINNIEITEKSIHERSRLGLARTFQTSSIFPFLSVLENVRLASEASRNESFNIFRAAKSNQQALNGAQDALEQVGLTNKIGAIAGSLSHGDKRRLEIAIVMASHASIVMLDEPMAGMSVENIPALVELIRTISAVHKKTVLIVEHHLEVVLGLASQIAVLNYGELITCDTPENVMANPIVKKAYVGESL